MSRVLVIGHVPLPFENLKKFYAPGARTWHFSQPLIADGHEVVIVGIRIPFVYDEGLPEIIERQERGCIVYSITQKEVEKLVLVNDLVEKHNPDCIIAVNSYPSYIASIVRTEIPLWADINGCLLAEAQMKASVYDDDWYLEHFDRMDHRIIARADRFSTVSLRQKYELVGEIAYARRLTSITAGYDFVSDIPNALPDTKIGEEGACALREKFGDDFLVLWSGGYNTWTDVETLFKGLSMAMEENRKIRFVSTGGSIDGHDEVTYPRFVSMVEASVYPDRFLLEGWIDHDVARSYYLACDLGINIDAPTYEVMFGSRNRIVDWAGAGLPALSTDLCELTEELARAGLLFTFEAGNPESLTGMLVKLAADKEKLDETGVRLKRYVRDRFSYDKTTSALREWVRDPSNSPDFHNRKIHLFPPPPITPESSALKKLKFYVKSEGLLSAVKRILGYVRKKVRGGESQ